MPHPREYAEDAGSLRRFGLALVRDDRIILDDSAAARLVEKLTRQSGVSPIPSRGADAPVGRVAAYARLIQLYRRHVRRSAIDDDLPRNEQQTRGPSIVSGVRALPVELREALLLVCLARLTHAEAAKALDLPISRLIERLERARARLAAHMGVDIEAGQTGWTAAAHLRVIK